MLKVDNILFFFNFHRSEVIHGRPPTKVLEITECEVIKLKTVEFVFNVIG